MSHGKLSINKSKPSKLFYVVGGAQLFPALVLYLRLYLHIKLCGRRGIGPFKCQSYFYLSFTFLGYLGSYIISGIKAGFLRDGERYTETKPLITQLELSSISNKHQQSRHIDHSLKYLLARIFGGLTKVFWVSTFVSGRTQVGDQNNGRYVKADITASSIRFGTIARR